MKCTINDITSNRHRERFGHIRIDNRRGDDGSWFEVALFAVRWVGFLAGVFLLTVWLLGG